MSRQTNSHRFSRRARAAVSCSGVGGGWVQAPATASAQATRMTRAGSRDPALVCAKNFTLCLSVVPVLEEGRTLELEVVGLVAVAGRRRRHDGDVVPVRRIQAEQVLHEEVIALARRD